MIAIVPCATPLLICGYSDMSREAYAPLLAWRDEAAALGVSQL